MKEIINDFRGYFKWLSEYLKVKRLAFKFDLARRMADMLSKAQNKQISVIINRDKRFEYWTSKTLNEKKKQGAVPKTWGMYELGKVTFYKTPISQNNKLNAKERAEYKDKFIKYARRHMK